MLKKLKYKEEDNDITKLINASTKKVELYTLTFWKKVKIDKNDYMDVIKQKPWKH